MGSLFDEIMIEKLHIITPSIRPENLDKISKSINIPRNKYNWTIIFDSGHFPDWKLIPINCFPIRLPTTKGISGNSQRNLALDLISTSIDLDKTYILFNDDDTEFYPSLWENIKDLDNDFISFSQENKDGTLRLKGDKVMLNHIDSHNFLFKGSLLGNTRWVLDRRDADGVFAYEIYQKAKNPIFIDKVLSTYNSLR